MSGRVIVPVSVEELCFFFFDILASEVLPYLYGIPLLFWWEVESASR